MATIKEVIKNSDKLRDKNVEIFIIKLNKTLKEYLPKVLKFKGIKLDEAASVLGGLMDGLKDAGLNDALDDLRNAYADELLTINSILKPVSKGQILSTADKEIVEALIDYDAKKVTSLITPYIDDIGSSVFRYAINGETPELGALLEKTEGLFNSQISTEIDTLLSGFSRTVTAKKAKEYGLTHYRYYPSQVDDITRDFCRGVLEDRDPPIYTEEEINAMNNGQDLDVMTFCGGYNCRHMWIPTTAPSEEEKEEEKENEYNL